MHADQPAMTNTQYTSDVERGEWPPSPSVPVDHAFRDERGVIRNVLLTPLNSVAVIESKRGAVRANHWHRTDWHYALVASGRVLYFERALGERAVPEPIAFGPGEMFFTPPGREHAMLFAEDSVILTFAKNVRSHENHEADLVRVEVVSRELADKLVPPLLASER
jgi:quercetin dioxygenase-like cupin family protein